MSGAIVDHARRLLAGGKSGEAVVMLEQAVSSGGGPALRALLGHAYYQCGRLAEAGTQLKRGVDLFPFDVALQEALARVCWMAGDGEAFASRFLDAINRRPRDVALRFRCSELLRQAGQTGRCERLLREGLQLDPGQPVLSAALGVLLDEVGQLDEALGINIDVVRAYNGAPLAQLSVAHTLMRLGRADDALRVLPPLRERHPDLQLATTYEATALKQLGDSRHDWFCDYHRHVRSFVMEAPSGYSSIAAFNADLGALLRSLMDAPNHPLDQSLRGGSQTSSNLIFEDAPLLRTYFEALDAPIQAYIDDLGDDPRHPLDGRKTSRHQLSGCWSISLRPRGFHVNHTHPEGWLSSSYYVSLPQSVNADSEEGWIKFGEPRWPIPGCGIERVIQPREGLLVLFPSYMWHGTIPFESGERLTAPFDVVPVRE